VVWASEFATGESPKRLLLMEKAALVTQKNSKLAWKILLAQMM
jgi:hypothetical protein